MEESFDSKRSNIKELEPT